MHVLNPLTNVYNPGGQKEYFFFKRELHLWWDALAYNRMESILMNVEDM